jgi:tRNA threonylcarbamoyladenosine biosynthesis protein TsaE
MRESDATILVAGASQVRAEDVSQMRAIGAQLALALESVRDASVVISLRGDLGAGKTTLVGGFMSALGHRGPVRSPTYTLVEPYELAQRALYHLDLYRLVDPAEVEGLGVRDLLIGNSVLLIEWPEKGGAFTPPADLDIAIEYAGAGRELKVSPHTPIGRTLQQAAKL